MRLRREYWSKSLRRRAVSGREACTIAIGKALECLLPAKGRPLGGDLDCSWDS
jgi:hypothetical protein